MVGFGFETYGGISPVDNARLQTLENNEYKILYFASVNAATGTIAVPANATIILNDFPQGLDAIAETIVGGVPTGLSPSTAGGVPITVSSFDASGNYTLSDVPSAYPVAILYILKIKAIYYSNLNFNNIIESQIVDAATVEYVNTGLAAKQNTLVSGVNIKTVGGISILNAGNIAALMPIGTTGQYFLGDGSLATIITNNNQLINGAGYITSIAGAVTSVSGTANRITSTGGSTPTIDISALYVGQSSITTLGTISTGVWNGTAIADGYISSSGNWNTAYSNRITSLTVTGNSGAATLLSNTLNIPTYTLAGLGGTTLAAVNAQKLNVFAATTSAELAGVISDETGSGSLVFATSPTFVTPTLGVASATSLSLTGTGGNGYIEIPNQSSTPSTPTAAGRIYFDNSNRLTWLGTNGFFRTFDGTANTASRTYVLPDASTTMVGTDTTQTITEKTIKKRTLTVTQSATPATNIDLADIVSITAQAQAITSMSSGLTGTPYDQQMILWEITDNGTARAIAWGASFASTAGATLPTTTVVSTLLRVLTQYNAATGKHECLYVN